jgi:hypothetical protein
MQKRLISIAMLASIILLVGCNADIVGQDNSKLLAPLTPTYTGAIPNPWYLYTDGLNTGAWLKGLDFYSGGSFTGTPTINLSDPTMPDDGTYCMRFAVGAQTTGWWCGMILLQGAGFPASNAAPGVDIRAGNFTKCVFRARALQGNRTVTFQTLDATDNITVTVTSAWQTYTIPFSVTTDMAAVKQFFSPAFGDGIGTLTPIDLFIDDLRYQQ